MALVIAAATAWVNFGGCACRSSMLYHDPHTVSKVWCDLEQGSCHTDAKICPGYSLIIHRGLLEQYSIT